MLPDVHDSGQIAGIELIKQRVNLSGLRLIDVGCGDMGFTKQLVEHGAIVTGFDPDPVQAELNRKADAVANLSFVESGADRLPIDDTSIDGIVFSFSLHHIPASIYHDVFTEVSRVLKSDGFLCVIEPTDCPLNGVMKLFHNEDQERADAQKALAEIAMPAFESAEVVSYHSFVEYESFEKFADRYGSRSFNSLYSDADVRRPAVKTAFEKHGPPYRFVSPKQMAFFRKPLSVV